MNPTFENDPKRVQAVLACNNASIFTGQKPGILCLFTPGDATSLKVALEGLSSKVIWEILLTKINTLNNKRTIPMTTNDLIQHEFENDIQRFMQIREQVHEEIKKISTYATTLDQTNKRLVAHFDVFEKLSEETQEHMKVVIKEAAREMARESAQQFSQLIKDSITHRLLELDRSVQNAQSVLDETMGDKYKKLVLFCFIGVVFSGLIGLGGGYFYAKQNTYALPENFIRTYARGLSAPLITEKQHVEKQTRKK